MNGTARARVVKMPPSLLKLIDQLLDVLVELEEELAYVTDALAKGQHRLADASECPDDRLGQL
jgi:hypothetical protein